MAATSESDDERLNRTDVTITLASITHNFVCVLTFLLHQGLTGDRLIETYFSGYRNSLSRVELDVILDPVVWFADIFSCCVLGKSSSKV